MLNSIVFNWMLVIIIGLIGAFSLRGKANIVKALFVFLALTFSFIVLELMITDRSLMNILLLERSAGVARSIVMGYAVILAITLRLIFDRVRKIINAVRFD